MLTSKYFNQIYSIIINITTQGDEVMSIERTELVKMGKHLADLRKSKKLTQMQLADILDVSNKTVSKWEVGDIAPDITILLPLSDVLGVSIEEILSGGEEEGESRALSLYNKMTKRKLIREIIVFGIITIAIIFLIGMIENYYRWDVTEIKSNGDNYAHGYIIKDKDHLKIIIDSIVIINKDDFKTDYIKYYLLFGDNVIYQKERNCEGKSFLNCLSPMTLFFEDSNYSKGKYDLEELTLGIEYTKDGKNKYIDIYLTK